MLGPSSSGPPPGKPTTPELVALARRPATDAFLTAGRPWLEAAPDTASRRWAAEAEALAALPALSENPLSIKGFGTLGVPGRKHRQIEHFAAPVHQRWPAPTRITDWCAGKGHLEAGLSHVTGGKAPGPGVAGGAVRGRPQRVRARRGRATFACVDVRAPEAAGLLAADDVVVALHACGGLHTALLRAVVARGAAGLALAPCCYNQPSPDRGRPLSPRGAAVGLALDENDLDLLHRQAANASQGTLRRSRQNQQWRLSAFDALYRQASGVDAYRPMPPFPEPWLVLPFAEFCRRLAALEGLHLPDHLRPDDFLAEGEAAWRATVARDAIRGLFARPLETWLVLDRARFLAEAGYVVEAGTFCDRTLTPRNALILARKDA
ncbi:MAG: methyltransferase [bacterium]